MTEMKGIDYSRLHKLSDRINRNLATKEERDELMSTLHGLGKINDKMYRDYTSGRDVEELLEMGVTLGAILLLGDMLSRAHGLSA